MNCLESFKSPHQSKPDYWVEFEGSWCCWCDFVTTMPVNADLATLCTGRRTSEKHCWHPIQTGGYDSRVFKELKFKPGIYIKT